MGFFGKLFGQQDPHEEVREIHRKLQERIQEPVEVTLSAEEYQAVILLSMRMAEDGTALNALQEPGTPLYTVVEAMEDIMEQTALDREVGTEIKLSLTQEQWTHLGIVAKSVAPNLRVEGAGTEEIDLKSGLLGLERSIGNALRAHNQALGRGGGS